MPSKKRKPKKQKVYVRELYGFIQIRNTKPLTPKQFVKWFDAMMKRRIKAIKDTHAH